MTRDCAALISIKHRSTFTTPRRLLAAKTTPTNGCTETSDCRHTRWRREFFFFDNEQMEQNNIWNQKREAWNWCSEQGRWRSEGRSTTGRRKQMKRISGRGKQNTKKRFRYCCTICPIKWEERRGEKTCCERDQEEQREQSKTMDKRRKERKKNEKTEGQREKQKGEHVNRETREGAERETSSRAERKTDEEMNRDRRSHECCFRASVPRSCAFSRGMERFVPDSNRTFGCWALWKCCQVGGNQASSWVVMVALCPPHSSRQQG